MTLRKLIAFALRHEYLIWILCLNVLLRLPSLLEPYWYGDEGIYLTLGVGIRKGLVLYKEIHDNKPPLLYFLAAISGSVFWFRFLLITWHSASIIVFNQLAQRFFDVRRTLHPVFLGKIEFPPLRFSTLATALFALVPIFAEGNIANGEIFQLLPILIGFWTLMKAVGEKVSKRHLLFITLSGFFFSLAFLLKAPAFLETFAAGFFGFIVVPFLHSNLLVDRKRLPQQLISFIKRVVLSPSPYVFIASFFIPILVTIIYYSFAGVGEFYVRAAFLQNVGYLSSWQTGSHEQLNATESGIPTRAVVLAAGLIGIVAVGNFIPLGMTLSLIWFACSLFGALLSGRPYPHYLINVIPPAALLVTFGVEQLFSKNARFKLTTLRTFLNISVIGLALGIGVVGIVKTRFWYYPVAPYYRNYIQFVLGSKSRTEYFTYFDPRLNQMYDTATSIVSSTTPEDSIFIWGDIPTLYALTRRLPPGRYTSAYHIKDFNGYEETITAIESKKPKLIIVDTAYEPVYPGLQAVLDLQYVRVDSSTSFWIYKRLAVPPSTQ